MNFKIATILRKLTKQLVSTLNLRLLFAQFSLNYSRKLEHNYGVEFKIINVSKKYEVKIIFKITFFSCFSLKESYKIETVYKLKCLVTPLLSEISLRAKAFFHYRKLTDKMEKRHCR